MTKLALATAALLTVLAVSATEDTNGTPREDHGGLRQSQRRTGTITRSLSFSNPFSIFNDGPDCADVSPITEDEFDLDLYTEKSWYIQKQKEIEYQPANELYCVTATYNQKENGYVKVRNTGNRDGVDGDLVDSDADEGPPGGLVAQQVEGGQIRVGPSCFQGLFFGFVAGPYWIVALGTDSDGAYSWAIVSGGPPTEFKEEVDGVNYCTTPNEGRESGLWLLTRDRIADQDTIDTMMAKLTELGYYTDDLIDVPHSGCTYPDTTKV